jgi:transposase
MGVVRRDACRISLAVQEDLRRRAVAAVRAGHSQAAVSTMLGVSAKTVWRWVDAVRRHGSGGLKAGRRGRRPGEQKALDSKQEARLRRAVLGKFPDQVALPGLVWTRPQVRQLIRDWFGIGLSLVTVGKYLRSWELSPQKPVGRAYEQHPAAVTTWLKETYPAIAAQAKREKAVILWLDQTGLRSDAEVGTTWAPVGQTPVVPKAGRRFGTNVMAAMSNEGELYFTGYTGYSPELNPVEPLDGDLKHHASQTNPANRAELAAEADRHPRRRQNQPEVVKALFGKPEVRYAAE